MNFNQQLEEFQIFPGKKKKTGKAEVCNKVVLGCVVSTAGSLNSASMRKNIKLVETLIKSFHRYVHICKNIWGRCFSTRS